MRGVVLLALACGCNPVFGIESTTLVDAPPDSPPIDAPAEFVCPERGGPPPAFGTTLTMVPARQCTGYAIADSGLSAAMCGSYPNSTLATGPTDGPLEVNRMDPMPADGLISVRLAPEGDLIIILYYDASDARLAAQYVLTDGVWKVLGTPYLPDTNYFMDLSTPTRGPTRRLVLQGYDAMYQPEFRELEVGGDGKTWTGVRKHPLSELGVNSMVQPSLSPDGLRLVFVDQNFVGMTGNGTTSMQTQSAVFYTDRPDINSKFRIATRIESVPTQVAWPYMTENCGRIYFGALDTVWYLEQPR